ncbi:heterokaryon incompatibility protein-domain-containing protein [Annulohypoxylon moriforme]|nr:heterokaryon incompatibility protein-domain-containing protein [Annulohypoxylon moriforme]
MWLINTNTLKLENITNPSKDSYAILSHTWEDEKITFQNFSDLSLARRTRGFRKIKKTCQLARERHMLEYAWVDTCCIDKTSSAELSEAINSMFRWYQAAAVCFVHLSDMPPDPVGVSAPDPGEDAPDLRDYTKRLEKCKWFRRGWTLQELLAPRNVEFYDANWGFIETKNSWLLRPLSDITGIDTVCLRNGSQIWD